MDLKLITVDTIALCLVNELCPARVSRVKESVPSTSFALMAQNNKAVSTPIDGAPKSVGMIAAAVSF
jgi:hypothetical protein